MVTSTRRLGLALAIAWLLLGSRAHGQTDAHGEAIISTDRPAVSNSSVVVPRGSLQIENGFLATDTDGTHVEDFPESNCSLRAVGKSRASIVGAGLFPASAIGRRNDFRLWRSRFGR
jgi:hypothetical protein